MAAPCGLWQDDLCPCLVVEVDKTQPRLAGDFSLD